MTVKHLVIWKEHLTLSEDSLTKLEPELVFSLVFSLVCLWGVAWVMQLVCLSDYWSLH